MEVALDFAPGMHGHFLEYICNRYILNVPVGFDNIFHLSGASHNIDSDSVYQQNKIVSCGHYSSFDCPYTETVDKIIYIRHNKKFDFVLLNNIYYRCHDTDIDLKEEDITNFHYSIMLNKDPDLPPKNNWYTKLIEHQFDVAHKKKITNLPTYEFDYANFFSIGDFLTEIRNIANFLNSTFLFDQTLIKYWQKFINGNQGYNHYTRANYLFDQIVQNKKEIIEPDWKIHAYLNYKISTIFNLYDNVELFQYNTYPTDTQEIYSLIIKHVQNFDNYF